MTLHLDFSKMGDRHLVIAYIIILAAQLGYATWVALNLRKSNPSD